MIMRGLKHYLGDMFCRLSSCASPPLSGITMKQHAMISLGLLLSGCAMQGPQIPSDRPSDDVIKALMSEHMQKVSFVQQQLSRALRPSSPSGPGAPLMVPKAPLSLSAGRQGAAPLTASAAKTSPVSAASSGHAVAALPALRFLGESADMPALVPPGQALTLHMALARILPPDWHLHFDMGLKPEVKQRLRWKGNDQWTYVLNALLAQQKLQATVDWSRRKVSVFAAASVPSTPSTVVSQVEKARIPAKRNPFAAQDVTAPTSAPTVRANITSPAVADPARLWMMATGSTLKDSLMIWAAEETCTLPTGGHWTLQWLTPVNYRIDAPLVFKGRFMDALDDVFRLYLNASVPLYAGTRLEQCQVVVSDKEPQ